MIYAGFRPVKIEQSDTDEIIPVEAHGSWDRGAVIGSPGQFVRVTRNSPQAHRAQRQRSVKDAVLCLLPETRIQPRFRVGRPGPQMCWAAVIGQADRPSLHFRSVSRRARSVCGICGSGDSNGGDTRQKHYA
jgi:hypothetical protein